MFTEPPVVSLIDGEISKGTFLTDIYQNEIRWANERYLYQKLNLDSDLIDDDIDVQSFYTTASSSNLNNFYTIDLDKENLFALDNSTITQVSQNITDIQQYMEDLAMIDFKLGLVIGSDAIQLEIEKTVLLANLEILTQSHNGLINTINTSRNSQVNSIYASNNAITTTTIYEENLKTVNAIYLSTLAQGITTFNDSQKTILYSVAVQCSLTGGEGVYWARGLYTLIDDDVIFDDNCGFDQVEYVQNNANELFNQKKELGNKDETEEEYRLYPNPTKDYLTLEYLNDSETSKALRIFDIYGKMLKEQQLSLSDNHITINVSNYPKGVYFVQIQGKEEIEFSSKIIVIK
jgi:hypothetical protein